MRFNNNLFLLASFFGVAIAFRRTCRPDLTGEITGTGYYTVTNFDTLQQIAADFCSAQEEMDAINLNVDLKSSTILKVPCRTRKRDCSRIKGDYNRYYTFVDSDQLSMIAADFCIDVNTLRSLNPDASETTLSPKEVLKVPCA
ncbi:putative Ecp7(P20) [Drepanopeziza brunnea f. sp. 'multigermtubi' MB_m1]|uniref:LysM06p n=2 Tax=Drepanopeziza brunnea f. sp. 'multigermtubi' TaxID=698441 RepID=J9XN70_9HELO|nr:putative Ecp7(P20) [Drepanopeziza brunnea f. sp. 'multigermtubi' MB_m1]AFS30724.1 LysM06p [Drepanopeziza brunnea f. sp. 'multigermtubi']EKD18063.1 putative Ecp7(P20) [Drepanopeziza brunnea f. sp. 'multigermtubi' MB_m1]